MEKNQELKQPVADLESEFEKFYVKHNKAAGTRIRKAMQDLKALAQAIRVDISEKKNE